ncbi:MAG: accessory factor UbiK family protein [Rhodospirillales bacterium]|nr:accessory factor UbiK family protein [Rhodospirillales bacterium]
MQTSNRLLDDLAKVANGAVSTLSGVKTEIETLIRQQIDKLLVSNDLVAREEFEVVKAMAAEARLQQENLEKRVEELEAALNNKSK